MNNISQPVRKKVLFLITKSNWGGAQRYVHDLAVHLPADNYQAIVAAGGDGPLFEKLATANIETVKLGSLQRDISILKELKSVWQIASVIRQIDPDVIHINSSKAGLLGAFISRFLGVPRIIFTAHGWAFNENRGFISRLILKTLHWLTVILSHQTIVVSNALREQLSWPGTRSKMIVVYNGRLQTSLQSKERSRLFLSGYAPALENHLEDFWSISIGELHPVKQHEVALKAMAEIVAREPRARHVIIGAGEAEDELMKLIKEKNLTENVFLLGHVDEASHYLKAADLFILPSRSEALAYVAIEACQAGIPIIASRVGGLPEIITNEKDGLLVPSGDVEALCTAYERLLNDGNLRHQYAEQALLRGQDFSVSKMIGQTIKVYENDTTKPRYMVTKEL